jgi:hypothetical protein
VVFGVAFGVLIALITQHQERRRRRLAGSRLRALREVLIAKHLIHSLRNTLYSALVAKHLIHRPHAHSELTMVLSVAYLSGSRPRRASACSELIMLRGA